MNPADKYERFYCATCGAPMGYNQVGINIDKTYCGICAQDLFYTLTQLHIPGYQQFVDMMRNNEHEAQLERVQASNRLHRNLNQFVIDKNS